MIVYRIEHKTDGTFWDGSRYRPKFVKTGLNLKNVKIARKRLKELISTLMNPDAYPYSRQYIRDVAARINLNELTIREIEITEIQKNEIEIPDLEFHLTVRKHLASTDYRMGLFYDRMMDLGVVDQIEFIFSLKPLSGKRADMETVKEARKKLRLLKVKTRTFREYKGMFGFVSRDQAMRARLSLDVLKVVDLRAEREKIKEHLERKRNP